MIFPWLEDWIHKVNNRTDHNGKDEKEKDRQLPYFLRMLMVSRSIVIQDSAVRMEKSPDSVFAKHEITRHPAFTVFLEKMNRHMENENSNYRDPNLADDYKAVDRLCSPLSKSLKSFQTVMEYGFKKNIQEVSSMKATLDEINDKFDKMAAENVELKKMISELTEKIIESNQKIVESDQKNAEISIRILHLLEGEAKSNITLQDPPNVTQTRCESTTSVKQQFLPFFNPTGVTDLKNNTTITDSNPTGVTELEKNTAATDLNSTSVTDLKLRKIIFDVINDGCEQTKSIKQRNMLYKTQGSNSSLTNSSYERDRLIIRFLKKLKLRINNGRLNMHQLTWLVDEYRTNHNLSLSEFLEHHLHDIDIEAIIDLWAKLSEEERAEVSSLKAFDGESDNEYFS